jgi:tetratricopeptide (TPR) repeat protein
LLTGQVPFAADSLEGVLEKVVRGDCPPARQVKPAVPAALEAVCNKAMAIDPEQRYESARALAEEVERWLADEQVLAYREPLTDRLRRWSRRHRSLVSGGVALLLAGVLGLALGLWAVAHEQAHTAAQRDRAIKAEAHASANLEQAQANLKLAKKAVDECFNVAKNDPLFQEPRMEKARKLLLKKTLPFYKNFRSQRPDDRGLQMEEADQWFRVAYIEHVLVQATEARQAYEKTCELQQKLVKANPGVPGYQQDLASTHNNLAMLLRDLGKREQALKEYRQARDICSKLVKEHPEVPEYQRVLADTHINLGILLSDLGKPEEALKDYRQARDIQSKLVQAYPEVSQYQNDLASAHYNLGILRSAQGKRQQALKNYQQARDIYTPRGAE